MALGLVGMLCLGAARAVAAARQPENRITCAVLCGGDAMGQWVGRRQRARATRARCPPGGCGRASTAVRACIGLVLPGRWRSVARVGLQAHMLHACVAAGDGRTGTKRPATGAAGQSMPSSEAGKDGRAQEWVTPRGVVPTQCLVPEPTEWSGSPPTGLCLTSPRVGCQDGRALEWVTPRGVVPTQCLVPESTE
jgi:hypothetical protein